MADEETIEEELDALAADAPASEEAEGTTEELEAASGEPALVPEADPIKEALEADPELAAKFEYGEKLEKLGKTEAAQKIYDEIEAQLGLKEEVAPAKTAEPPPFIQKQSADDEVDQEVGFKAFEANIRNSEKVCKMGQKGLGDEYNALVADLNTAAGRILDKDELRMLPAVQAISGKWQESVRQLEKLNNDKEFLADIEKLVEADPSLKRIKRDFADAVYNGRINPYVPKSHRDSQLRQIGLLKASEVVKPKITKEAVERMRNKNAPKIGASKGPSAGVGGKPSAKTGAGRSMDKATLQMYKSYGMKNLGV